MFGYTPARPPNTRRRQAADARALEVICHRPLYPRPVSPRDASAVPSNIRATARPHLKRSSMSFSVSSGSLISLYSRRGVPTTDASSTLYAHRLALAVAVRVHSAARQRLMVRVPGERTISPPASFSSVSRLDARARGAQGEGRGRRIGGGGKGGGGEKRPDVSRYDSGVGDTVSFSRWLRWLRNFPTPKES